MPTFDKMRLVPRLDEWLPERDGPSLEAWRRRLAPPEEEEEQEAPAYYVGIDLGKSVDYTAICISEAHERDGETYHKVRWIRRLPLGTRYMKVASTIKKIDAQLAKDGSVTYAIDSGGVGEGVSELIERAIPAADIYKIYITGGGSVGTWGGRSVHLAKSQLISNLIACFERGAILLPSRSKELAAVQDELDNFSLRLTQSGHETYGASAGHDDLVLAMSLCFWIAQEFGGNSRLMIW